MQQISYPFPLFLNELLIELDSDVKRHYLIKKSFVLIIFLSFWRQFRYSGPSQIPQIQDYKNKVHIVILRDSFQSTCYKMIYSTKSRFSCCKQKNIVCTTNRKCRHKRSCNIRSNVEKTIVSCCRAAARSNIILIIKKTNCQAQLHRARSTCTRRLIIRC